MTLHGRHIINFAFITCVLFGDSKELLAVFFGGPDWAGFRCAEQQ